MYRLLFIIVLFFIINYGFAQWTKTNGPYGGRVKVIEIEEGCIYAGTLGAGIFKSTDHGENWSELNSDLMGKSIYSLSIQGDTILAGTVQGVYWSTDSGESWNGLANFCSARVISLHIGESSILAGTDLGEIYRATNLGYSWTKVLGGDILITYWHLQT